MTDTRFKDSPVCPHCGKEIRDAWELNFGAGLDGECETDCGSCGESMRVERHVFVNYSTVAVSRRDEARAQ